MFAFDGFGLLASAGTVWTIIDWTIRIGALFIVPRNRKPTSGTAWLMVIFLFPPGGLLLYLIIGSPKLPKGRREAQEILDSIIEETFTDFKQNHDSKSLLTTNVPPKYKSLAMLSESLTHLPAIGGNKLELISDYNEAINSIVRDIDKAEHHVHLEYFIIVMDEITEPIFTALARAHDRGVHTRVMYDWFSIRRYPDYKKMLRRLKDDGIAVQPILPFKLPGRGYVRPDLRNHRKLVVIDGHTGYTGSQNLVRRNYHRKDELYYDELVVRLRGPVVMELSAAFITDWYSETGHLLSFKELGTKPSDIISRGDSLAQILPSGPGYEHENNLKTFIHLIYTAQKQITIVNPYFVPDEAIMTALTSAVRRGVKVTLVNSEAMDQILVGHAQRSFYEELLRDGVAIHLYKAPILLHSKFMIIDDDVATIGSSNFDIRSFELNLEITLISYDAKIVKQLLKIADDYIERSLHLKLQEWQARPRRKILLDNLARLTSALQ